jgi:hypothetical protein
MCRLRVSLRFDDPTRNLDAALALQFEIVREYVSINCFDGGEKDLGQPWLSIALTAKADQSVTPIECAAIGGCSEGPKR